MSVVSTAARWLSGKARLVADLPAAETKLAELEAKRPHSADPAEHIKWIEECDAARRNVEALRGALAIATAEAAKAEAAQVESNANVEHAAAEKQAKADEKLVRAAFTAIERASDAIEALVASNAAIEAANAIRGQRAWIADAETRVRQRPGGTIDAVFEDRTFWCDSAGNQPTIFVTDRETGEMRPQEAGYSRRVERVCVQPERIIPPTMPDRLAELLPALRKALTE
ncbi:hypothetical protein Hden_0663 [Hyphomicrobium denitrificans ATCC 51888]|uniref:Uncharacterized protein n=1 Tax=Hyphomicrobium denitrificans (strain ATCC 51888 / DSM 1869 / NCIMB 11706 / TK 0415) TaxID=582899 RepID=D8JSZ9_HYPDA|nr:hypothetical protein [Hyphomicrobium denitrificans]ADJ22484.1 hypothetical protein Hden_0663 [Hyphomicrobium denitrificans ATCC 51888]